MNKLYRLTDVKRLVIISNKLSTMHELSNASSFRVYVAEEIFNKFVLQVNSFAHNLPIKTGLVDLSVIASICRMVIETHNSLHYFCDRTLSKDQVNFRIWLYNLHYHMDLLKIIEKLDFDETDSTHRLFSMTKINAINEIENNNYYKSFTEKERKKLIKGSSPYYWRGCLPKKAPYQKTLEEGVYKLLSNFSHSFPVGNAMYKSQHPTNHLSFNNSMFLAVETAINYSASAIAVYCSLRNKVCKRLKTEEKNYIKNLPTQKNIDNWVEDRKNSGNPVW